MCQGAQKLDNSRLIIFSGRTSVCCRPICSPRAGGQSGKRRSRGQGHVGRGTKRPPTATRPRSCRRDDAEIARTRTRVAVFKGKQQGKARSEWNGGTEIFASQQFSCQEDRNASHDRMNIGDSVNSGRIREQCIGAKSNTNERTGNSTNRRNYVHDRYMYGVQEMVWNNARRGCKPIEKG